MDDDTAFRSFITHGELLRDVADLVIWGVKGMGEISGKIWIRKVGKPEGGGGFPTGTGQCLEDLPLGKEQWLCSGLPLGE